MKYYILLAITFFTLLSACHQSTSENRSMQARIDSLEQRLSKTYKPGFGEFMSGIQVHHAKLWFAGQAQNWELADFEIHEIQESLAGIREYCTDRKETKDIAMIDLPIDSLAKAIEMKSLPQFRSSYTSFTNTCNNCHQATDHAFNVLTIPSSPPVSNQEFKVQSPK